MICGEDIKNSIVLVLANCRTSYSSSVRYVKCKIRLVCLLVCVYKHHVSLLTLQERRGVRMRWGDEFGKHKAVSSNVGWGCWSVNQHRSNKEQDKATDVSLNSDSIQEQLPHSRETLHNEALFNLTCTHVVGYPDCSLHYIHFLNFSSVEYLLPLQHVEKSKAWHSCHAESQLISSDWTIAVFSSRSIV